MLEKKVNRSTLTYIPAAFTQFKPRHDSYRFLVSLPLFTLTRVLWIMSLRPTRRAVRHNVSIASAITAIGNLQPLCCNHVSGAKMSAPVLEPRQQAYHSPHVYKTSVPGWDPGSRDTWPKTLFRGPSFTQEQFHRAETVIRFYFLRLSKLH